MIITNKQQLAMLIYNRIVNADQLEVWPPADMRVNSIIYVRVNGVRYRVTVSKE